MFKFNNELEASGGNMSAVVKKKQLCKKFDVIKINRFVQQDDGGLYRVAQYSGNDYQTGGE